MSYAKDLEQLKKDTDNKLPDSGENGYPVTLIKVDRTLSDTAKTDMFVFFWKIIPVTKTEKKELKDVKGKEIRKYYVINNKWARLYLLQLLESMGADLEKMGTADDIEDFFDDLDVKAKARCLYENVEGNKYPKLEFFDVAKVVESASVEEEEEEEEEGVTAPD